MDLVADMTVINPFDFFVESYAEKYPFAYPERLKVELRPFLETEPPGPLLSDWLAAFRLDALRQPLAIVDFLVAVNQRLQRDIAYIVRLEPGIQSLRGDARPRSGIVPRLRLAAGADPAASRPRGALRRPAI